VSLTDIQFQTVASLRAACCVNRLIMGLNFTKCGTPIGFFSAAGIFSAAAGRPCGNGSVEKRALLFGVA